MSDITLADFWGIEKVNNSMEKNLGTSLVIINSKKGEAYFEKVKKRINYVEVPFKSIESGNPSLNKPLTSAKVDRQRFFEDLDKMTFLQIAEKYILSNSLIKRDNSVLLPLPLGPLISRIWPLISCL